MQTLITFLSSFGIGRNTSTIPALTEEIQMCGRFTFQPIEVFCQRFQIGNRLDSLLPRYNIAPGQMVPVIIANSPRQTVLTRGAL